MKLLTIVNNRGYLLKFLIKHDDTEGEVSQHKDDKMDYEYDMELCEYNPISIELQNEIKALAQAVEKPAIGFLKCLMQRIVLLHGNN